MALTILERPIGVVLGTCVDANINQDYNGFATVNKTSHNLSDNDWVYIQCDVQNYNGFWQIDVINANEFALRNTDGTYVSYVVDANITYCPGIQTHGFSCVHLPITYKIINNKYPVNSVDTVRTITGLSNNSNFAQIDLSGTLGTFEDLQFIKISNAPDSNLDGVYQIIDKISNSSVILNVAYTTFTNATILGASIQLYYGNYNVVVRVYAGINSSHGWASEKPYELAATLELIPDENNEVFFSINDILKPYVKTENNLLLPSLPNNIDAWTNFYISTAEQYDASNGYTIATTETGFTSDQDTFEGTAVNAMLEFKNDHSGYLSDYINPIRWLTLFDELTISLGQYFDLSFINSVTNGTIGYRVKGYINDVLQFTNDFSFNQITEQGVYRFKPEFESTWDKIKVSILYNGLLDNFTNSGFTGSISPWINLNPTQGTDIAWVYNSNNVRVTFTAPSQSSQYLTQEYNLYPQTLRVTFDYVVSAGTAEFVAYGFNPGGTPVVIGSAAGITGTNTGILSGMVVSTFYKYIIFKLTNNTSAGTIDIDNISISSPTGFASGVISDELTINIDSECTLQEINLQWINNLGGFDQWTFNAQTGHAVDISEANQTKKNTFPQWPKSWGANADTIRKQTSRTSMVKKFITSQFIDNTNEADAIAYIKSSPLVQIVNSRQDRRTVIVDTDSFVKYTDGDKLVTISFNITYTDDIPSQKV